MLSPERRRAPGRALDAGALDLHEGISDAGAPPAGCARWPKALRLHSTSGKLVPGRCRSTRLCDYCAKLEAVEVSELLALDAMDGNAPEVYAVLTSARVSTDPAEWYEHRRQALRAVKRRFPAMEYCCITEFTTGRAGRSGGLRRPHFNLLLKGIPAAQADEAAALLVRVWCERLGADAEPWAQYGGAIAHEGGLLRYLALHFLKESQRPPKWWHGHRVTRSRGYLTLPSWKARARAKGSLRLKRAIRSAELAGHDPAEALAVAELELLRQERERWLLVTVEVDAAGELTGMRPTMGGAMPGPRRVRPHLRTMGELMPELFVLQNGDGMCPANLLEPVLQTPTAGGNPARWKTRQQEREATSLPRQSARLRNSADAVGRG